METTSKLEMEQEAEQSNDSDVSSITGSPYKRRWTAHDDFNQNITIDKLLAFVDKSIQYYSEFSIFDYEASQLRKKYVKMMEQDKGMRYLDVVLDELILIQRQSLAILNKELNFRRMIKRHIAKGDIPIENLKDIEFNKDDALKTSSKPQDCKTKKLKVPVRQHPFKERDIKKLENRKYQNAE